MALPKEREQPVSPFTNGETTIASPNGSSPFTADGEQWLSENGTEPVANGNVDPTIEDMVSRNSQRPIEALSLHDVNRLLEDRKPLRRGVRREDS